MDLFTEDEDRELVIPPSETVEVDPVRIFLNRWCFNWRGERDVIEQELRELIAESERRGER